MEDLKHFLKSNKVSFKHIEPYRVATTHMSWTNEMNLENSESYERLEFLGDAALQLAISEYLFDTHGDLSPGEMTLLRSKVVNKAALAKVARELKIQDVLLLGKGEKRQQLADSVMEDVLEAFIGAMYVDLGWLPTKKFVTKLIAFKVDDIEPEDMKDFKTKLQEHLQAENRSQVSYVTDNGTRNEDGQIIFKSEIHFHGVIVGTGQGLKK